MTFTYYYTIEARLMRTHLWTDVPGVPIMVVATSCWDRQQQRLRIWPVPAHCQPLAADSGGFTAARGGGYRFSADEYCAWLTGIQPAWAATMDLPCEPEVAADDLAVEERQAFTLRMAHDLLRRRTPWLWVPVVQGMTEAQYSSHAHAYQRAGLQQPYMAIGSLCRRTSVAEITGIIRAVSTELPGTRFHLFGVKLGLFMQREALPACVASADSAVWNGRFKRDHDTFREAQAALGTTQTRTQLIWALPRYQAKVARALGKPKQLSLFEKGGEAID